MKPDHLNYPKQPCYVCQKKIGDKYYRDADKWYHWECLPKSPITKTVETKAGNTLSFFYNPENNLLVIDLIAKNENGGNELLRKTLDEKKLLGHTKS